jgi:RNA polymerase sigma factor (sigma-70 family)
MSVPNDHTLIDLILAAPSKADRDCAFRRLIERYDKLIRTIIWRILDTKYRNLQDEAVQRVWINIFRSLATFQSDREFKPWLCAVVENTTRDLWRSERLRRSRARQFLDGEEVCVADRQPESRRDVSSLDVLDKLTPKSRRLLKLFLENDGNTVRVAEELGQSRRSVQWQLRNLKKRLRY